MRRWRNALRGRAVRFGLLRRLTPISDSFGFDRGLPIDRYYIEQFLTTNADAIRGHVLEFGDSTYTRLFGNGAAIDQIDIVDVNPQNTGATLIADVTKSDEFTADTFDCVICTQTLPYIYDVHAAVRTLHRVVRPGGTVLATVTHISRIWTKGDRIYGDYWRFTPRSSRMLFEEAFAAENIAVTGYGNVLSAAAFLYGLAADELKRKELDFEDDAFPVLIGIKATK